MKDPESLLQEMFEAAVAAADPMLCVPPCLPDPPADGRTVVVGAGKASAVMGQALERHFAEKHTDVPIEGVIVTRYGYAVPCERIEILEAAHPVPDAAGLAAAEKILETVSGLTEKDLVICLISGGGSALLTLPAAGMTLTDKQAVNQALLASGATINEMNCIRRHLSRIKGGQLAAACAPARVVSILISDVPGDEPQAIASGPTVPDLTTFEDARRLVEMYGMSLPASAVRVLEEAACETPKPDDPLFRNCEVRMAATPRRSLEAAAEIAVKAGVTPLILGDSLEGESREVGTVLAGIATSVQRQGTPLAAPAVLLSGGETTVTLKGDGRGGPNAECALGMLSSLAGQTGIHAICCDTDGIDGAVETAGAMIGPETFGRARAAGLDPALYLRNNDAYGFFDAAGGLVKTGPTRTNVNDFRAVLVTG